MLIDAASAKKQNNQIEIGKSMFNFNMTRHFIDPSFAFICRNFAQVTKTKKKLPPYIRSIIYDFLDIGSLLKVSSVSKRELDFVVNSIKKGGLIEPKLVVLDC